MNIETFSACWIKYFTNPVTAHFLCSLFMIVYSFCFTTKSLFNIPKSIQSSRIFSINSIKLPFKFYDKIGMLWNSLFNIIILLLIIILLNLLLYYSDRWPIKL